MIVDTPHGEFEVKDITRKERRKYYRKVKTVFAEQDQEKLHDLSDEFALLAFKNDETAEKKLGNLTALQEDEVLTAIIIAYMGLKVGNSTGD
ncbi:MAG: hypothetical protein Unbinned202contig1002_17 [Prokaryotic dsDNA virus sp.]|nr:MAG: hypothetical protein Unbinned202contig1002_17 [Prokaryotic dsDNA virus sp.]|tara:strand:+ start:4907 stop:5182 length:276 start_codon:yes stop_codon:yes gene_type:complete